MTEIFNDGERVVLRREDCMEWFFNLYKEAGGDGFEDVMFNIADLIKDVAQRPNAKYIGLWLSVMSSGFVVDDTVVDEYFNEVKDKMRDNIDDVLECVNAWCFNGQIGEDDAQYAEHKLYALRQYVNEVSNGQ